MYSAGQRKRLPGAVVPALEAGAVSSDPQGALPILGDGDRSAFRFPFRASEDRKAFLAEANQPAAIHAGPHVLLAILI